MSTPTNLPPEVAFTYLKSPHFRVLHTDGAVVSIGPQGSIHMSLFSERTPLPEKMVHKVTADGKVGDEIAEHRVSRGGIVREVDIDAVLTLESAIAIRGLLDRQIELLQGLRGETK